MHLAREEIASLEARKAEGATRTLVGLRGLELSCSWDMEPMWHPVWEPLWQAVNEVNLPLQWNRRALQMGGGGYNRRNIARAWTRVVEAFVEGSG